MRSLLITFSIAMLCSPVVGGEVKFVIHAQDILNVCADDAEVEVTVSTQSGSENPTFAHMSIEFSFPLALSSVVFKDVYICSTSYIPGTLTVRFRFKDAKTAAVVAAFIDAKRGKGSNQPMQPSADGPYA
jgi:hypothetical protein